MKHTVQMESGQNADNFKIESGGKCCNHCALQL
jgi:hypothetical protein